MAHLIDKDAVVAEIKKRIKTNKECMLGLKNLDYYQGKVDALNDTISFLDTLEVKEVNLEKETKKWWKERLHLNPESQLWMDAHQSIVFAKHFFELGLHSTITEEDCKLIWNIGDEIPCMTEEEFFKELLKRYKAQKGE